MKNQVLYYFSIHFSDKTLGTGGAEEAIRTLFISGLPVDVKVSCYWQYIVLLLKYMFLGA